MYMYVHLSAYALEYMYARSLDNVHLCMVLSGMRIFNEYTQTIV